MTFMTLLQRIDLEVGKKNPSEVKELNLSHSKSTSVEGISEEYVALETLNLTGIGLESLSSLPKLPSLKTLSNLRSLYLMHCKVENTENYRKLVFAAIPNLKYLDGWDENNESEPESEDQVGNFPNGDLEVRACRLSCCPLEWSVHQLAENNLSGGLEVLVNCPNLEQLNLSSNKIDSIDTLTPLAKLSNLRSLYLMHCKVENTENYRKLVFAAIPNLKYLDGWDENNESEPESEDQVGNFPNGDLEANGGDNEDENDSEDDEDEEYGIEALQRSDDLEDDDEEDYAPGEEEEAELDEYDDIDEEDEEEEDEDVEDNGANLSGAGVTGPRRPGSKRRHDDSDEVGNGGITGLPAAKHKSTANTDTPADDGVALDE
ncbi:uncharacterized protein DEA37_0013411 [Paragonimus westermani]|uniref:U2A'/phosphoprotein 32 family A C-terminal domain-containing protein n=1 Tax=Paragonimus westermani TaxID=34504 RepID=A0A5J4NU65_9TREM|nr:uncharacterized protein DEA37_0013411 [Paragonimus westermani]